MSELSNLINLAYSVSFTNTTHSMVQIAYKCRKEVCLFVNNYLGDPVKNAFTKSHNHSTIDPSLLPKHLHEISPNPSKSFKPPIYLESNPFNKRLLPIPDSTSNLDSLLRAKIPLNDRYFSDARPYPTQIQVESVFSRKSSLNVTSSFYKPYNKSNNQCFEGTDSDYQMVKDTLLWDGILRY